MNKLLIITGPTASGKTALGIELAKKFNGEIISADSRQVYRGNDIETGKDRSFPQWGIDIVDPGTDFSVSDFVKYATQVINDIQKRGKLPIVVGGSGQYIKELLNPSETLNIPPNQKLRKKLNTLTLEQLQLELMAIDRKKWESMNESDKKNPRRLVRAIETTKKRMILLKLLKTNDTLRNNALVIGLMAPKEIIYQKIVTRRRDRPDLVNFEFSLAKRQMTYLKKHLQPIWFDITSPEFHNKVIWQVAQFTRRHSGKKESMPAILPREKK